MQKALDCQTFIVSLFTKGRRVATSGGGEGRKIGEQFFIIIFFPLMILRCCSSLFFLLASAKVP